MSLFCLYRDGAIFSLTKDGVVVIKGGLKAEFSPYSFIFSDADLNDYEMKAKGLFFWKTLKLFKNNVYVESYTTKKSISTQCYLKTNGDFYMGEEKQFSMIGKHKIDKLGRQYFYWNKTNDDLLIQSFCIAVLSVINGMQSINGTG